MVSVTVTFDPANPTDVQEARAVIDQIT
ncbi:MAG: hypothetical protein JWP61_1039, partial [Friedmanniella sp.]|nr:hypothetical protein [Friedmanniella sp.]